MTSLVLGQFALPPASEATPANDNRGDAVPIVSFPFTYQQDVSGATREPDEPSSSCGVYSHSVWFSYIPPSDTGVMVDSENSSDHSGLTAYSVDASGDLTEVACSRGPTATGSSHHGQLYFGARAGKVYLIKATLLPCSLLSCSPRTIQINAGLNAWPNDNFTDATPIESFPFSTRIFNNSFTKELGEPQPNCRPTSARTAWWKLTVSEETGLLLDTDGSHFYTMVAIYTGDSFDSLSQKYCAHDPKTYSRSTLHLRLSGPETYYLQIASNDWCCTNTYGMLGLNIKQVPVPTHDNFSQAREIVSLPYSDTSDNSVATAESNEPRACGASSSGNTYSVWYRIRLPAQSTVRVDTSGNIGRRVAVYEEATLGSLTTSRCGSTSLVLAVRNGIDYYVEIFGYYVNHETPTYGEVTLSVNEIVPSDGDSYAGAVDISGPNVRYDNNLLNATAEPLDSVDTTTHSTLWYRFTPTKETGLELTGDPSTPAGGYMRSKIATGTANDTPQFLPGTMLDYRNPGRFHAKPGVTYNIQFEGDWRALTTGALNLWLSEVDTWPNYIPSEAMPLDFVTPRSASTFSQYTWQQEPTSSCTPSGYPVWYKITSPNDAGIILDGRGSDFPTVLSVYSGTPEKLQEVACSLGTRLTFQATAGTTYYVRAAGDIVCGSEDCYFSTGTLKIRASQITPPANDIGPNATPITSVPFSDLPDLTGASNDGITSSCGTLGQGVWYSFTPVSDVGVRAIVTDLGDSSFRPRIALLQESPDNTTEIGCASAMSRRLRAGNKYRFLVGGVSGKGGPVSFSLSPKPYPGNDDFMDAIHVSGTDFSDLKNTETASLEKDERQDCGDRLGFAWAYSTVWYRLSVPVTSPVVVEATGFDTVLSVFTGESLDSLIQVGCNNNSLPWTSGSLFHFVAEPNKFYYIRVGGAWGSTGDAAIRIRAPAGSI